MSGVCAGNPASTALGDVVIGAPVYEWDEDKPAAIGIEGDHQQHVESLGWPGSRPRG